MLTPQRSTYRRAREIRAELKIPKKSTPTLPADVPRLYEGYKTPPRAATQVGSISETLEENAERGYTDVRGERIPCRPPARRRRRAYQRARRRTMRASARGRSTCTASRRGARRARRAAAVRSAVR